MARGRTVIHISHRLDSLVDMDAILVMDAGRVVDCAPHPVPLQRCPLYRQLWQIQHPASEGQAGARAGTPATPPLRATTGMPMCRAWRHTARAS